MELDVLIEAIDGLASVGGEGFADAASVVALERQLARLDAVVTQAVAVFDAAGNWQPDGARTAVSWLTARCRLAEKEARGQVRRGRALAGLGHCRHAFSEGSITRDHLDGLVPLARGATAEAFGRDEQHLVQEGSRLRHDQFVAVLDYWRQMADPDGSEEDAQRRRERRDAYLVESVHGMWLGQLTLDPVSGAIVAGELGRLDQKLFESDWAEAEQRLGREPTPSDLARTPAQRRADALVEMATRSGTAPKDGRRPAPLFSVLVGWETLRGSLCRLEGGPVLPPASLLPWLDRADLERAVFAPGKRVEVSQGSRLFSGATRRAIELRDQECTHPTCAVPARRCQVDHVVPWAEGGPTTQENGRLLCGFHNRLRHQRPRAGPDG